VTSSGSDSLVALAERLQGICLGRGLTIGTAESCTGGLVASSITDVAGSSGYFRGGIVAYADDAKASLLDVPGTSLPGMAPSAPRWRGRWRPGPVNDSASIWPSR
jgi:nicotinamide-nucleotide amidase